MFGRRLRAEGILQEQQRRHSNGKQIPDIEVQQQIARVEVPWFGSKDVGPSIASAEDIVKNDPQWHDNKVMVEENIYTALESLLLSVRGRGSTAMPYQSDQRPDDAIQESSEGVVTLTGENTDNYLFEEERSHQDAGERPTNDGTKTKPHDALGCLWSISPVHESGKTQI